MFVRFTSRIGLLLLVLCTSLTHAQTATTSTTQQTAATSNDVTLTSQASQTLSGSGSAAVSGSAAPSSVSINPVDPPGGVSMIDPPPISQSSVFYKIGTTVTFSWSYTSVQATPTAVNVEAYCSLNKFYYPVAEGISYSDTNIQWDTGAYDANATQPLLTAMYTLYIFDANRSVTAVPSAGYLGSYIGYVFGLYEPQPYTPLPTNTCVICSSAPQSLIPSGLWWMLGITAAFLVGGWRVVVA